MRECPNCGRPADDTEQLCPGCGTALPAAEPAPAEPVPAAEEPAPAEPAPPDFGWS